MHHFIINTRSGKGAGERIAAKIRAYMKKKELPCEFHVTTRKGHAKELAEQCPKSGDVVVAVGGDGTFHEVLNGLNTEKYPLGFIPCGRGNDFAASMGLQRNPIKALETVLHGESVNIDYIKVGDNLRCLNAAGTGLDVAVLERVENKREDKLSYLMALIYCLNHFTPYRLTVESGGESREYSCIMVGVCNGKQFGGGIKLSPLSNLSDGKLNVVTMEMPRDGKIMKPLMKFVKGKHLGEYYASHFECEKVTVTAQDDCPIELDGEIYRDRPLVCEVVKGGLKTFRP